MSYSSSGGCLRTLRPIKAALRLAIALLVFALATTVRATTAHAEPGIDCFSAPRTPSDKNAATDSCWYTREDSTVRKEARYEGIYSSCDDDEQEDDKGEFSHRFLYYSYLE